MNRDNDDPIDFQLIWEALDFLRVRSRRSWPQMDRDTGVSRSTLDRIKKPEHNTDPETLRRIETGLNLPWMALQRIGERDLPALEGKAGVPEDLLEWARERFAQP